MPVIPLHDIGARFINTRVLSRHTHTHTSPSSRRSTCKSRYRTHARTGYRYRIIYARSVWARTARAPIRPNSFRAILAPNVPPPTRGPRLSIDNEYAAKRVLRFTTLDRTTRNRARSNDSAGTPDNGIDTHRYNLKCIGNRHSFTTTPNSERSLRSFANESIAPCQSNGVAVDTRTSKQS